MILTNNILTDYFKSVFVVKFSGERLRQEKEKASMDFLMKYVEAVEGELCT